MQKKNKKKQKKIRVVALKLHVARGGAAEPSRSSRLEQLLRDDLVDHAPAEVGHVLLREGDGRPARQVVGVLAGEHAAVGAVHLLRDLLHRLQRPIGRVQRRLKKQTNKQKRMNIGLEQLFNSHCHSIKKEKRFR